MAAYIYWLQNITQSDREAVGGKGANLGDLYRGLRTAEGYCLSALAYQKHLAESGLNGIIGGLVKQVNPENIKAVEELSVKISGLIMDAQMPREVAEAVTGAYRELAQDRPGFKVAVRSSATAEDLASASFAGQLETILDVDGAADLVTAVKKCWASLWTPRAIHYRGQKGFNHLAVKMAVIIQEMVPARAAGVMFTADPVTNSRNEIRIEAVRGLGEQLVSGQVAGDVYIFAKNDVNVDLISRTLADPSRGPILTDFELRELAHAGIKIERFFDDYQDVEWAIHQGKFYFLQARPVTTLADEELPDLSAADMNASQREIMDWVAERFPDPIFPIDGVVVKILFLAQFEAMEAHGYKIGPMDWTRVEKGIFPEFFVPPSIRQSWSGYWQFLRVNRILKSDPAREWSEEQVHLLDMLRRLKERDVSQLPLEMIQEYITEAFHHFHFFIVLRYSYFGQNRVSGTVLYGLLRFLFGHKADVVYEDLLGGVDNITLRINRHLYRLAMTAGADIEVRRVLAEVEPEEVRTRLEKAGLGTGFLKGLDELLNLYGDRETSMGLGGIAAKTWQEAPEVVIGILKSLLEEQEGAFERLEQAGTEKMEEAERKVTERLHRGLGAILPIASFAARLIRHARSFTAFRENSHYDITRGLHVFRILFHELGRRLVKRGLLQNERDIFYLTYFEIKDIIMTLYYGLEDVNPGALAVLIEKRKAEQERRVVRWQGRQILANSPEGLRGVPASRGIVSGPVRIIKGPWEFSRLRKGDIIVAPYTNPAWTPLFSTAVGIVAETGGAASHAAIVAREYGIPAVMGVAGACELLADGERITLNGVTGLVLREDENGPRGG